MSLKLFFLPSKQIDVVPCTMQCTLSTIYNKVTMIKYQELPTPTKYFAFGLLNTIQNLQYTMQQVKRILKASTLLQLGSHV